MVTRRGSRAAITMFFEMLADTAPIQLGERTTLSLGSELKHLGVRSKIKDFLLWTFGISIELTTR